MSEVKFLSDIQCTAVYPPLCISIVPVLGISVAVCTICFVKSNHDFSLSNYLMLLAVNAGKRRGTSVEPVEELLKILPCLFRDLSLILKYVVFEYTGG